MFVFSEVFGMSDYRNTEVTDAALFSTLGHGGSCRRTEICSECCIKKK